MKSKWELTMRGRMLAVLASLALCGAWITGDSHACVAAALLIAPIVIDRLWKGRGIPPIQVATSTPRTQAKSPFTETVHVRNGGRRGLRDVRVVEHKIGARGASGYLEDLSPQRTTVLKLPARALRRGRFRERVFACETCYPLGILRTRARVVCAQELISEPSRIVLPHHIRRALDETATEPSPHAAGGAGEFYALRDYRYGEDARNVHALRSAAAGALLAVDTRGQRHRHPCLVLDLRRPPGYAARKTGRRFEWSLSATATLVDDLTRAATPFVCIVLARQPRVFEVSDPAEADDLLTYLAEARPHPHGILPATLQERIESAHSCFWIPAGGFSAVDDRSALSRVVLVTQEHDS